MLVSASGTVSPRDTLNTTGEQKTFLKKYSLEECACHHRTYVPKKLRFFILPRPCAFFELLKWHSKFFLLTILGSTKSCKIIVSGSILSAYTQEKKHLDDAGTEPRSSRTTSNHSIHNTIGPGQFKKLSSNKEIFCFSLTSKSSETG